MDGHHLYQDATAPGLKPMSEGMRNWRASSGYDRALSESKGEPCQIVSEKCTGLVEHLHEPLTSGRNGGKRAAVRDGGFIPACDACNDYCSGDGMEWATLHGFLFSNTIEGKKAAAEAKTARNLEQEPPIVKVKRDPYQNSKDRITIPRSKHTTLEESRPSPAQLPPRRRSRLIEKSDPGE